jgi:spermidine/putrescine transport system ATP-binding protein
VPPHRRPFNTVFQSYALFPHLTVDDNIGYGLDVAGVPRDERRARVAAALGLVGLTGLERRKPRQLSGGQQQRVALARAIVNEPRLLLLDEPLSALDRKLRLSMQVELKNLQHTLGITFLYVTHDQEEALAMSDRIAVMDRGRILQLGPPTAVYHTPANRFVAGFVGTSNILAGRITGRDGAAATVATERGIRLVVEARGFAPGARVDVMLRPEGFEISPGGPGGDATRPSLDATVEQVVFVGSALEVRARLEDGTAVTVLHRATRGDAADGLAPGQAVRLAYDPAAAHVMPGEG